jgi:TetR/AcrR family fatty acid metabolism transcriptional regulator
MNSIQLNIRAGFNMANKTSRKEEITRAAIEIFGKNEFRNSSISEIAKLADIAEGTIYQYFKNKEELFFSIAEERSQKFCEQLDLHLQGIAGSTQKLGKFVWYYLYFFQTNPNYARTLMLEMRVSKRFVTSDTYESVKKFADMLLEILKEGQGDIYLCRHLVLGLLEHMVTRWLLKETSYDLTADHKELADLIMNGIAQKDGPAAT